MKTVLLSFLVILSLVLGCKRSEIAPDADPLIASAQRYFEIEVLPHIGAVDGRIARHLLAKEAHFEYASIQQIDGNQVVIAPVYFPFDLHVKRDGGKVSLSTSDMTRLIYYVDGQGNKHTEVVTSIPDDDYIRDGRTGPFTGTILVEDWLGHLVRGYRLNKDGSFTDVVSTGSIQNNPDDVSYYRAPPDGCGTTDWYSCAVVGGQYGSCSYMYSEPNNCGGSGGSTGGNGGGPGGSISPGGYGHVSSGGGSTNPNPSPASTKSICTKSFKFTKVVSTENGGGWQVAAVKGIHMNLVDTRNGQTQIISPGTVVYFGLPVIRTNGTFYSTDYAATLASDADRKATDDVYKRYRANPGLGLDMVGMGNYYRDRLSYYLSLYGGRATLTPGTNIVVAPTEAKYSGIAGIGCL